MKHCVEHQEDIELICIYKGCKQPYLCLLCFQDHKKICPAIYKVHIQKISHHMRERYASKEASISQIEALFQQKAQIITGNHELAKQKFTEIKEECQKHFSIWLKGIEGLDRLLPHHIHIDTLDCLGKKLDEIKKLDFGQANHVESVKDAKILEGFIASREVQDLSKIAQTLKAWTVCRNRLEGQKTAIIDLLENMQVKDFFSSPQQISNDKNTRELESLKAANEALKKYKNEVLEEKDLLNKKIEKLIQANKDFEDQNTKLLAH